MVKFYKDKFKEIRSEKYKDLTSFAKSMGISRRTIWVWETGQRVPAENYIRRLARKMKIPVSAISDLEDEAPASDEQFPDIEKHWRSFASEDELQKDDKFVEVLYTINRYRNELKQSVVVIRALLSSMEAVLYIKDANLKYLVANKSFLELTSMPPNISVAGKTDSFFFSKADTKINTEQDEEIIRTGKPLIRYESYIPGSRNKKWGLISKIPIVDTKGKISGLVGTFVDITERKIAERTRQLLDICVKSMHEAFILFDKEKQKYIYVNEAVKGLGYAPEEFYKKGSDLWFNQCIHPDDRERQKKIAFTSPANYIEEFRIVKPDNEIRWVNVEHSNITIGNKKCVLAISRDITDRKKAEEVQRLLEETLNNFPQPFSIRDVKASKLLFINKATEKMFGYPLEYFREKGVKSWINESVHEGDRERLLGYVKAKTFPKYYEFRFIKPDTDGEVHCANTVSYSMSFQGRDCVASINYDITDKKKSDEVNELLKLTLHAMSNAYSLRDLETNKYLFINPAIEKVFGYKAEDFYNGGASFWFDKIVYEKDKPAILEFFKKCQWPEHFEYRILRPDGKIRWIKAITSNKEYLGRSCLATINRDITEKKERETEIAKLKKELEKFKKQTTA